MIIIDSLRQLDIISITIRVIMSLILGGILGIERERKNRPAGFRTYMLVCLGSTIVMMTNQYMYQITQSGDLGRLGAQVISGIGFLGAGTIIINGKRTQVTGLTTAAGLWTAACIGLAIGIGFYEAAFISSIAVLLIMTLLQKIDTKIIMSNRIITIYAEFENVESLTSFVMSIKSYQIQILDIQVCKNKFENSSSAVILTLENNKRQLHSKIIEILAEFPGIKYIEELV